MKKIYIILTAVFALLSLSLNAQTKANITVASSDFSDASWWTIINANNDSYTWSISSGVASIRWNSSEAANDWLVTSPIALEAGKTYTFSIGVWAESTTYGYEKFEVMLADANTATALSSGTSVISPTEVTWTSEQKRSATVTVTSSGNYYFGIHGISEADKYYLYVDNLLITVENTDPLIMASTSSASMIAMPGGNATETITVTGDNLTEDINASISGDAVFSVNPSSLGTSGGELTVTYSPTAEGNHTATLTLTSAGAETVTITLNGSCIAGTTYELVTDPSTQLVDGKKYIIVHDNYAMGPLSGTSSLASPVTITINGDGTVTVPGNVNPMVLTLHDYTNSYDGNYKYTFTRDDGAYLMALGGNSNATYLTTNATAIANASWKTVADVKSTGGYGIQCYRTTSRAIAYQTSGNRFGNYGTNNITANSTTYYYGLLYVEVDNNPVLTAPENGSTVNVGTLEEGGETSVSVTIPVTGRNLTEDLTVSVSGTGFTVTPATLSATDVNNGTATVTVTYTGTANGTGTLTIGSEEASTTVNLSATYIAHDPVLTAPVDGTTVDVGTNNGMGVSKTIAVSGTYLTEDLTVSVSGAGFTVSPTTLSADAVNNGTATVTVTYNGTTDATGTLTISSGEVSTTINLTGSYSTGIAPTAHGMVRMGTLRLVDQFAEKIEKTNDHPYRYTYFLKLAARDTTSSPARVPAQHTGATMDGYYTHAEMKGDTDPSNFLTEDMLSAEVDLTLSPSSAPYFYTINSVKNGVPASVTDYDNHYKSYLNVLQRREAGDYQEMQAKYDNTIVNPHKDSIYVAGAHDYFDYRAIQAEQKTDSLTYVPIVWTKGIERHYYSTDSLHNSYGAPIWAVHTGDVMVYQEGTVCQKQARWNEATQTWDWNESVNYNVGGRDYCLYFVSLNALGVLPVGNIEYEPYMFRLWLYDKDASLRNYTWELDKNGKPVKILDNGAYTDNGGKWKLLDTKMCENWHNGQNGQVFDPDLQYVVDIVDGRLDNHSWDENIAFVAPMTGFDPELKVRFYYKIKGAPDPTSGMRGDGDDDNVGYVVVKGHNPDPGTAVYEIFVTGEVESVIYYNIQGQQSDKPFDGINIVVTRYSNGATTTTKVRY